MTTQFMNVPHIVRLHLLAGQTEHKIIVANPGYFIGSFAARVATIHSNGVSHHLDAVYKYQRQHFGHLPDPSSTKTTKTP
jgi:hypothetical protein